MPQIADQEADAATRQEVAALLVAAMERRACEGWRIARVAGVHPSQATRWRKGEQNIPARCLVRIARYLRAPELLDAHPVAKALAEEWARPTDLVLWRMRRAMGLTGEVEIGRVVVVDGHVELRIDDESGAPWTPPPGAPAAVPLRPAA